jgi:hypothetical protein
MFCVVCDQAPGAARPIDFYIHLIVNTLRVHGTLWHDVCHVSPCSFVLPGGRAQELAQILHPPFRGDFLWGESRERWLMGTQNPEKLSFKRQALLVSRLAL